MYEYWRLRRSFSSSGRLLCTGLVSMKVFNLASLASSSTFQQLHAVGEVASSWTLFRLPNQKLVTLCRTVMANKAGGYVRATI